MPGHAKDPRTDQQLVDAINAGDSGAFDALYHRYRDWVVNLAYRFTGNRDAALDVMQETFMYVLRKFPGFVLTARFTTFLYPVVRHVAIADRRKARREAGLDDTVAALVPDTGADDPAAPDPRAELATVMAGLSDDHREVLLLRFVDGFTLEEIAAAVDVPVGTVKSRIHNALKQLRADPRTTTYFTPP